MLDLGLYRRLVVFVQLQGVEDVLVCGDRYPGKDCGLHYTFRE
jgi:hypothetical protein